MVKERFDPLIRELADATILQGKIRWQPTAKEGAFRVGLGDGMVRIQSGYSEEMGPYIVVYLIDRQGRVIDEYWSYQRVDTTNYPILDELYDTARASAMEVDKIIASMLDDLKEGRTRELPPENEQPQKPNLY